MVIQVQVYCKDRSVVTQEFMEQQNKVMIEAVGDLENEVPALIRNLENEFRSLLTGPTMAPTAAK
jgi:hypothetical protein